MGQTTFLDPLNEKPHGGAPKTAKSFATKTAMGKSPLSMRLCISDLDTPARSATSTMVSFFIVTHPAVAITDDSLERSTAC